MGFESPTKRIADLEVAIEKQFKLIQQLVISMTLHEADQAKKNDGVAIWFGFVQEDERFAFFDAEQELCMVGTVTAEGWLFAVCPRPAGDVREFTSEQLNELRPRYFHKSPVLQIRCMYGLEPLPPDISKS